DGEVRKAVDVGAARRFIPAEIGMQAARGADERDELRRPRIDRRAGHVLVPPVVGRKKRWQLADALWRPRLGARGRLNDTEADRQQAQRQKMSAHGWVNWQDRCPCIPLTACRTGAFRARN